MKSFRILLILGYLFWGFMLIEATGELILRNAWFELFEIRKVTPTEIRYIALEKESTKINYRFIFTNKVYTGHRKVINRIVEERLSPNKQEITISFNTTFPNINWIDQLELKTRNGNIGIILSLVFLAFIGLIDGIVNQDKWRKEYNLAGETKAKPAFTS